MKADYPENDVRFETALYVRELQVYLREIALFDPRVPTVAVDGVFGRETTAAVKAAQTRVHLSPTGRVDFATWEAIVQLARTVTEATRAPQTCAPYTRLTAPLTLHESGTVVPFTQAMFNGLCERFSNFEDEPVGNEMTATTCQNLREIQRVCGLTQTGVLDTASWNGLTRAFNLFGTDRYVAVESTDG